MSLAALLPRVVLALALLVMQGLTLAPTSLGCGHGSLGQAEHCFPRGLEGSASEKGCPGCDLGCQNCALHCVTGVAALPACTPALADLGGPSIQGGAESRHFYRFALPRRHRPPIASIGAHG